MADLFDPWMTEQPTAPARVQVNGRWFNQTLVDRANKRTVNRTGGTTWRVDGNEKLGDKYDSYEVRVADGEYECDCYSTQHGETRARKTCSHVLAVMLRRESAASGGGPDAFDPGSSLAHEAVKREREQVMGSTASVDSGNGKGHTQQPVVVEPVKRQHHTDDRRFPVDDRSIDIPAVNSDRWTRWDHEQIPRKFAEIHPHQWDAVQEIVDAYRRGVECVWLDAPTGSGKTFIAELVRRQMEQRAFYICHSRTLQDQFVGDFGYARVLKGRSNYPTLMGTREVTCADCTSTGEDDCAWCDVKLLCPYQVAKYDAIQSKLAVVNTAYFLNEWNYVGQVGVKRELGIVDECDTLESELMGFVEFRIGERVLQRVGVSAPVQGSHKTTIAKWLMDDFKPALYEWARSIRGDDLSSIRYRTSAQRMMADVLRIGRQLEHDDGLDDWIRDNRAGPMVLKPVVVSEFGEQNVWRHAQRWLCMSATIISADELSDSTGLNGGDGEGEQGRRWEVVKVPMTFPVENRRIIVAPVADMSKKGKEAGEWEHAATAIRRLCDRHPGERILVHTVSYELARYLSEHRALLGIRRDVLTYTESANRDSTLDRFRRTDNAVLFAASMDRGVDLADDDCRVIVVAKIPFPNLGDRQIGERMRRQNGQAWYAVQTVRKLVQMVGRAVRHKNDWCVTYIIDRQFTKNVWAKNKMLLPAWWREAVDMGFDVRGLMRDG